MSKWDMVKLGDIGDFRSGGTPSRGKSEYFGGNIPWITTVSLGKTLIDERDAVEHISADAVANSASKIISQNSIMVGIRVGVGKVSINTVPMCTNQDIVSIENIDEQKVYKKYIVHCIKSYKHFFDTQKRGATIQGINSGVLKSLNIPLPPIEIQKQIAQTLDTASELLAMRKQQLAELDNLIKSTFYDMFGDPIINEKKWRVIRLGDCLSVVGGYAFKSTDFSNEGIPVIKIGNINSGVFQDNSISFWEYNKKLDKYLLHPKDVVISLTGTVGKDDYANVCILPDKYPKYYLNQRNAKLELRGNINVYYLLYLLRDTKIKGQLTGISRGIRQANISNADILALTIPLPPVQLQTQFATIVTKIEEQKSLVKKAIDETQYLFDSLMSEYFE